MKLEERNGLRILTPEKGYFLQRNGDEKNFSEIVYLGKNDTADNYQEFSEEDKNMMLTAFEEGCQKTEEEVS